MKKYIAFLRGINVGNIRIKMTDLTRAFEDLGFKNVKTYLQTGNIVFDTEGSLSEIKPVLEKKISDILNRRNRRSQRRYIPLPHLSRK